jgi:AbrB family looped-hinge helix DNA binding protein
MRITSKGQVTIPKPIRDRAGLLPMTEVEFVLEGRAVRLRPARAGSGEKKKPTRGARVVRHLSGRGDVKLTTDQIMALTRTP